MRIRDTARAAAAYAGPLRPPLAVPFIFRKLSAMQDKKRIEPQLTRLGRHRTPPAHLHRRADAPQAYLADAAHGHAPQRRLAHRRVPARTHLRRDHPPLRRRCRTHARRHAKHRRLVQLQQGLRARIRARLPPLARRRWSTNAPAHPLAIVPGDRYLPSIQSKSGLAAHAANPLYLLTSRGHAGELSSLRGDIHHPLDAILVSERCQTCRPTVPLRAAARPCRPLPASQSSPAVPPRRRR